MPYPCGVFPGGLNHTLGTGVGVSAKAGKPGAIGRVGVTRFK